MRRILAAFVRRLVSAERGVGALAEVAWSAPFQLEPCTILLTLAAPNLKMGRFRACPDGSNDQASEQYEKQGDPIEYASAA
jgi:hypothetical protein